MSTRERIVVAMSGGVDSSTAAALLLEAGHEVVGVTLKLTDASGTSASVGGRCCSPKDIDDARATAADLGFPHYVLDHTAAFRAAVIDDFVAEHRAGRTPISVAGTRKSGLSQCEAGSCGLAFVGQGLCPAAALRAAQ